MQVGIVRGQHSTNRALDHLLFVVSRDQHRNCGFVGSRLGRARVWSLPEAIENCEKSYKQQTSRHEQIAEKEDPSDGMGAEVPNREAHPVQTGSPALIG